jgi:phosphoribosyl 1,2-cyclic phosphodiesterase
MKIKTIASSSSGCCYVIESNGEKLLIECGVSLKKIREALDFDFSNVVGCLISHEHADHCKSSRDMSIKTSIPVYGCFGSQQGLYGKAEHNVVFNCGVEFKVKPIKLAHDVECFGYVIRTANNDILLYATDTNEVPYKVEGLTHLMIEANHSLELLIESDAHPSVIARAADNHFSINQAVELAVRHRDTLKEVHLLHLSDKHSDEEKFKQMMSEALDIPVYIARK